MKSKKVVIINKAGIHCRPASKIMQKALEFPDCELSLVSTKGSADLNSILALLSIGLERGDEIEVFASGKDEERACNELCDLFALEFDFHPRI